MHLLFDPDWSDFDDNRGLIDDNGRSGLSLHLGYRDMAPYGRPETVADFADRIPSSTPRHHSADRPRQWKAVGDSAAVDGASVAEGPDVVGGWTPKSFAMTKLAAWSV
jgi:hypothetical protein